MSEQTIKEIENKLNDNSLPKYCKGKLLFLAKKHYLDEVEFKNWYCNYMYDREKRDFDKTDTQKLYSCFHIALTDIEYYEEQEKIKEQLQKYRDRTYTITDSEIEEFIEEQKYYYNDFIDLTDSKNELSFISHLINDPNIRKKYILKANTKFLNTNKMKDIFKILEDCDSSEENLSEYLIKNGYTAYEMKCLQKIKNYNSNKIEIIFSTLAKHKILRDYFDKTSDEEVQQLLIDISMQNNFSNITTDNLKIFLKKVLTRNENEYEFISDYKPIPFSESLNIQEDLQMTRGVDIPFLKINEYLQGFRLQQLLGIGMLSNCGKTRLLIYMIIYLIFIKDKKVLTILNETTKQDLFMCILTTAINNSEIQKQNNFSFGNIKEKEIRNKFLNKNEQTIEFKEFVEFVTNKINENLIVYCTDDYSDKAIKSIIIQEHFLNNSEYVFYDTLKISAESTNATDDLKKTATMLSELAKKYNLFICCSFQLTDETIKIAPENIGRLNIANSKQIYHVMDSVILFKEIQKSNYIQYRFKTNEGTLRELSEDKMYYLCKLDKNRIGDKPKLIFEIDLDLNNWIELGIVQKKNK